MKIAYVDVNSGIKVLFPSALCKRLPNAVGLFVTAQYLWQLDMMKQQLESAGKKVVLFRAGHCSVPGQILGCSIQAFHGVDALLYVGDGRFHPAALAMKNAVPVFSYNPLTRKHEVVEPAVIDAAKNTGLLQAFKAAKNVGVLVSTKPGQEQLEKALLLEKQYTQKKFYFLLANDICNLENFPFLDFFVNTACARISTDDLDKPSLNIDELVN